VNGNDYTTTEATAEYITTTVEEETTVPPPPPVTINGVVWRVAPELDIEGIILCSCGMFVVDDSTWRYTVDPTTGMVVSNHGGHGGGGGMWVFDPELELLGQPFFGEGYDFGIGMHPVDEFAQSLELQLNAYFALWDDWTSENAREWVANALETANRRLVLEQVRATQRYTEPWQGEPMPFWGVEWDETRSNFLGRFAIIENRRPISPWFDAITSRVGDELFAAQQGDTWQLINQYGEPILPLQFEHIVLIDEETAFVRHQGRYGILDIHATSINF